MPLPVSAFTMVTVRWAMVQARSVRNLTIGRTAEWPCSCRWVGEAAGAPGMKLAAPAEKVTAAVAGMATAAAVVVVEGEEEEEGGKRRLGGAEVAAAAVSGDGTVGEATGVPPSTTPPPPLPPLPLLPPPDLALELA